MYVTGKISSPGTFHNHCNIDDHHADLKCSMNGAHLECADKPCGGQKYKCDCFVYRFSFYKRFYHFVPQQSRRLLEQFSEIDATICGSRTRLISSLLVIISYITIPMNANGGLRTKNRVQPQIRQLSSLLLHSLQPNSPQPKSLQLWSQQLKSLRQKLQRNLQPISHQSLQQKLQLLLT